MPLHEQPICMSDKLLFDGLPGTSTDRPKEKPCF
jgi:hypothetical protein